MKILLVLLLLIPWANAQEPLIAELDERQASLAVKYLELQSKVPSIPELNAAIERGDSQIINEAVKDMKNFFISYDDFNLRKIDSIFSIIVLRARNEALEEIRLTGRLPKKISKKLKILEDVYRGYLDRKKFFATEKDMERLIIGQKVLPAYGDFAKALREARGETVKRNFGPAKIVPFIDTVPDFLKVSGKFLKLLWTSYFKGSTGKADSAPIPEALADAQRKLVEMRKIETKWEGLQNVQSLKHDGKTLHMFLINHANSFFDTSAQQAFPIKGMSSMGDVDVFFPAFLARKMAKSDHMIAVGHGDTTQKAIDLVKKKQLNRFFLAAEGITGVGLFEMRPIMPLFNFAVYDSIERGLELKLYPVAFPDNFRLMNDWRSPIEGPRPARGVVFPPITTSMCTHLKEVTGTDESVSLVIRWNWFAALNNSDSEVLSMPYPSELMANIEKMVWGNE